MSGSQWPDFLLWLACTLGGSNDRDGEGLVPGSGERSRDHSSLVKGMETGCGA
jgi:hypothetical protein